MMNSLKYFAYISQTKVDMLYSQIPPSVRDSIEAEVKFKLPLTEISFSKKQVSDNLYIRLNLVESYLEKQGMVGSIWNSSEYFRGTLRMGWAQIHPGIAFFGGKLNETVVGLGGSMNNLFGYKSNSSDIPEGISHTPWLISLLSKQTDVMISYQFPEGRDEEILDLTGHRYEAEAKKRALSATDFATDYITTRPSKFNTNKFEFLAKLLKRSKIYGRETLLGSPIYVSHSA
jgi:hypothetical protein